jgi:hypothetical protein
MKTKIFILASLFLGGNILFACDSVKIYFTNWNYLRRSAYTETDVRNKSDIFIQINDNNEIERLRKCLDFSNLRAQGDVENEAVDIVIDFIQDGMIRESYILNRFYYYKKGERLKYSTPEVLLTKYTLYK